MNRMKEKGEGEMKKMKEKGEREMKKMKEKGEREMKKMKEKGEREMKKMKEKGEGGRKKNFNTCSAKVLSFLLAFLHLPRRFLFFSLSVLLTLSFFGSFSLSPFIS